ncbi:MAG: hypothetical protein ACXWK4_03225 [Myxococcaceae bacterium]
MSRLQLIASVVAVAVMTGCAHDAEGHQIRTGNVRFDAQSVSSPDGTVATLNSDGTWGPYRLHRVGDQIRSDFAWAAGYYGYVQVDRLPNGVMYTPSSYSAAIWTFVTEDGKPLPADLEIPLYLAARHGLGGQWVSIWSPARDFRGPQLVADCGLVLFEMEGCQVAGWVARQGAQCPVPNYPGRELLARLIYTRNEVWVSPLRPLP